MPYKIHNSIQSRFYNLDLIAKAAAYDEVVMVAFLKRFIKECHESVLLLSDHLVDQPSDYWVEHTQKLKSRAQLIGCEALVHLASKAEQLTGINAVVVSRMELLNDIRITVQIVTELLEAELRCLGDTETVSR